MNTRTNYRPSFWIILAFVAILALAIVAPSFAQTPLPGEAALTGVPVAMVAIEAPTFATTLDGTDQTLLDSIDISVDDFSGTGLGWSLEIAATTFTDGSHSLAASAMTIQDVTSVCDGGECTNPVNGTSGVYPLVVPSTDGIFFSADADSGMGAFTITPDLELYIPANTYAGTYTSTVTITLASAP